MIPPLLSRPALNDLGDTIGSAKLDRLIERFKDSLREAFADDERSSSDYGREAHTVISMSGMLGCERLSNACRDLEAAAKAGVDLTSTLADIRTIRDETVAALQTLQVPPSDGSGPPANASGHS